MAPARFNQLQVSTFKGRQHQARPLSAVIRAAEDHSCPPRSPAHKPQGLFTFQTNIGAIHHFSSLLNHFRSAGTDANTVTRTFLTEANKLVHKKINIFALLSITYSHL